jgi:hypothetical protein
MTISPKQISKQMVAAWQAQVQDAADNPWLFTLLMREWTSLYRRFAHFYQRLLALPRPHKRALKRKLATTLAGTALLLALGQALPARAATITVDGVTCTLAEAIDSANNDDAAGNGCMDGSGADIIHLQTDVPLSSTLPPISSEITLEGNGYILDGNNAFRVLYVHTSGNLMLNEVTITGGYTLGAGGGIYNSGTLTVNNSTLSGNFATKGGGIRNSDFGTLIVNNSLISGNTAYSGGGVNNFNGIVTMNNSTLEDNSAAKGGGIRNIGSGTLTLYNSTLKSNSADNTGGGIYNYMGTVNLNNSTISGNSAENVGGGLSNFFGTLTVNNSTISANQTYYGNGKGGGIYNASDSQLTVNNSTLSGNSAGHGGGIANNGAVIVNNSTLSGNSSPSGGGIQNYFTVVLNNSTLSGNSAEFGGGLENSGGTVTLKRSLISGNHAVYSPEIENYGTVIANNYNVVGYEGDARSIGFTPGASDIIPPGALDSVLDANLADNGGPTFTHALVSGSVAIDLAPNGDCSEPPINGIDQRAFARNVDGDNQTSSNECDAGAFEYTPIPSLKVYLPIIKQVDVTAADASSQAVGPRIPLVVTLLTLGNLLFFKKGTYEVMTQPAKRKPDDV